MAAAAAPSPGRRHDEIIAAAAAAAAHEENKLLLVNVLSRCFQFQTLTKMMGTLNKQEQFFFGITTKLLVFRARRAEPKLSHAPFVIVVSLVAVRRLENEI